jgi:hypothetical protein
MHQTGIIESERGVSQQPYYDRTRSTNAMARRLPDPRRSVHAQAMTDPANQRPAQTPRLDAL